jgi:hypothetical protein
MENKELKQRDRRRRIVIAECVESIMNGIAGPGDLPGAKVGLAALLVKVGEQQAEQQGDYARNNNDTGGDRIHEARRASHEGLICEDLICEI